MNATAAESTRRPGALSTRIGFGADVYALGAIAVLLLMAQFRFSAGVTSDGCLYFSYLRSIVFDHDLQIGPEVAFLNLPPRPHYVVPVGPAIVWAPAYLIVSVVDWIGAALGAWTRPNDVGLGLTGAYVRAASISSLAIGMIGLFALHIRLRREFGAGIALLTSVLLLGATSLAWYLVVEPAMTHAASFGASALLVTATAAWLADRLPTRREAIVLGALCALVIIIRPEDGLFLAFPAAALLFAPVYRNVPWIEHRREHGASAERPVTRAQIAMWLLMGGLPVLAAGVAMVLAILPANSFSLIGGNDSYLTVLESHWSDVLFSSRHGLFSWTPVAWIGVLGTLLYVSRSATWAIPALLVFAGLVWTNGSAHDWAGGWAFGGRRFISAFAAFAPGFALALDFVRRRPAMVLAPVVAVFVGWNVLLMQQYQQGLLPRDEAVRFDSMVRQQIDLYLKPPYWYPFAFPANTWFAWREKLPVDRYDLLAPEPLRQEMYLPLNDWGARFLIGRWTNGAGDRFGSRHFLEGEEGTILVPLDVPSDKEFTLDVEARAEGGPGTAALSVSVNGHPFGDVVLAMPGELPTRRVFTTPPHTNVWRRGYNRVTISRRNVASGITIVVYALRLGPSITSGGHP